MSAPLTETDKEKFYKAGLVLRDDTLIGFRLMAGLTLKAFAGEMGMTAQHYENLESGKWKVKAYHLKAALNVVRLWRFAAGIWTFP